MSRLRAWVPRHPADYKSLAWLLLGTAVAACSWRFPRARIYLLPFGIYFSFAGGLIAHGHNHCPMFRSRGLNQVINLATTAFFGFPTFIWLAGHNGWHHKYTNGPGDPSAGWRLLRGHNLLTAVVAPIGAMVYEPVVLPFLVSTWRTERRRFFSCALQIAFYLIGISLGLGFNRRAFVWAFALPWLVGLYLIHYFNYIQHVHCDPASEYAHSRDWTGRWLNFFVFNQGFHTVHHNQPGAHWSRWRAMHEAVRDRIPAELQSDDFLIWAFRQYWAAPFHPALGTRQMGTPPWDREAATASTLATAPSSGDSL